MNVPLAALIFAVGVLAAATLSACSTYSGEPLTDTTPATTDFTVHADQRYTPPQWPEAQHADVYVPGTVGSRPAVLVVHGGGWQGRSRGDMDSIAERLARRGFVAVNVSYRFAPRYIFPAQLHDLQVAMHWMHDNAGRFGIDTERIGALGYSAGAHLVSLMALVAGEGGELDTPHGGARTRPSAVVAGGTPTDLRKFEGGTLVPQFLGGERDRVPERYAEASPITHVHPDAPPFFLYHGGFDKLVPIDHATDFQRALQQQGVTAELYRLRLRGHVTAFLLGSGALETAVGFLHRHLDIERTYTKSRSDDRKVVKQ